eukprot:6179688-Pleurochrysis_carterae.AAC.3
MVGGCLNLLHWRWRRHRSQRERNDAVTFAREVRQLTVAIRLRNLSVDIAYFIAPPGTPLDQIATPSSYGHHPSEVTRLEEGSDGWVSAARPLLLWKVIFVNYAHFRHSSLGE